MKLLREEYENIVYGKGLEIKCIPPEQGANALNYLITGRPLAGKALDDVIVEFINGEHKGKKAIFQTELYELIEDK